MVCTIIVLGVKPFFRDIVLLYQLSNKIWKYWIINPLHIKPFSYYLHDYSISMYFTIMESPKKIELVYIIDDCFPLISRFPELVYPFSGVL